MSVVVRVRKKNYERAKKIALRKGESITDVIDEALAEIGASKSEKDEEGVSMGVCDECHGEFVEGDESYEYCPFCGVHFEPSEEEDLDSEEEEDSDSEEEEEEEDQIKSEGHSELPTR